MALISLIFPKQDRVRIQVPKGDDDSLEKRDLLIIDASNNIRHQHEVQPTDNPVEEGSDVTDNIDVKPKVVTFDGIISEAPITIESAVVGNVAGAVGALGRSALGSVAGGLLAGATSALGGSLLNQSNKARVEEAFNAMQELQSKKILCTIITGLRAYENMVLQSFSPVESADVGGSLSFTATFREIRVVRSEQVVLPKKILDDSVAASAGSVSNQGKKTAEEADEQLSGRGSSFLADLLGVGA